MALLIAHHRVSRASIIEYFEFRVLGFRAMAQVATRPRGMSAPARVLTLLCAMYFINYIVRVNVATASAVFQPELHLTNLQVAQIFSAFAYPYLAFQLAGGWVADRFGARRALELRIQNFFVRLRVRLEQAQINPVTFHHMVGQMLDLKLQLGLAHGMRSAFLLQFA